MRRSSFPSLGLEAEVADSTESVRPSRGFTAVRGSSRSCGGATRHNAPTRVGTEPSLPLVHGEGARVHVFGYPQTDVSQPHVADVARMPMVITNHGRLAGQLAW